MATTLSIISVILAVLAITFSAIALHKSISNEKYIDDIYEWAEQFDKLIDRIIETIGMKKRDELKEIETLALKIDFDKEGNPIIPDELNAKLKPEQLQDIEKHLRIAKKIGDGIAEIAEQRNHAVPKIDPHPTFDFPAYDEQRTGERMTTGNKRKSPEPHNVIHHSDDFWLEICREYQTMRHSNPNLTQADFVRIKSNPRIKIKTFNAKLLQLTKTGAFTHKPRTRRIK